MISHFLRHTDCYPTLSRFSKTARNNRTIMPTWESDPATNLDVYLHKKLCLLIKFVSWKKFYHKKMGGKFGILYTIYIDGSKNHMLKKGKSLPQWKNGLKR